MALNLQINLIGLIRLLIPPALYSASFAFYALLWVGPQPEQLSPIGDLDIAGAIIKSWLEHFRAKGPKILCQQN